MSTPTLKIRCPSWRHLENFYSQKVKEGNILLARVPFSPVVGSAITIALDLPDGLTIHLDGQVNAVQQAADTTKSAIRMTLHGLDGGMRARLQQIVIDGLEEAEGETSVPSVRTRAGLPVPVPSDVPIDEVVLPIVLPAIADVPELVRERYAVLKQVMVTLQEKAAHEVLGVTWDADVSTIRLAYFKLVRMHHPDVVAKYDSPEITMLASELFVYINKAYDRLRDSAVAAGKAIAAGPALLPHQGWITSFEDLGLLGDKKSLAWTSPSEGKLDAEGVPASPSAVQPVQPVQSVQPVQPVQPVQASESAALRTTGLFSDARDTLAGANPITSVDDEPAGIGLKFDAPKDSEHPLDVDPQEDDAEDDGPLIDLMLSPDQLLTQGRGLMDEARYGKARRFFAALLEKHPRNRSARALYHVSYGHTLLAREKSGEALTQFEVALKHDPQCQHAKSARSLAPGERRRPSLLERILGR